MASSSLSEPFTLATYMSSSRGKSKQKNVDGVYASSSRTAKKSEGFVTVAAQADGVHVLDISAINTVVSHTLGPSTSFSCPPLTVPSSSSRESKTYTVISLSPDISPDEAGRMLWEWKDDMSSGKQIAKQNKLLFSEGQIVHGLYSCDELPNRIIALSTTGDVSLIYTDTLDIKSTSSPLRTSRIIQAYCFSATASSFHGGNTGGILVIVGSETEKTTYLRIMAIDEANSISQIGESEVEIDSKTIVSLSFSNSGVWSILTKDAKWHSYQLPSDFSLPPTKKSSPLHLSGFNFLNEASKPCISVLALTSSHALLAGVLSHEIILLLWDLQFSVVLTSQTFPIPSALSSSTLQIRLVSGNESFKKSETFTLGHAILILSSVATKESGDGKTTSVVVAVPYVVPRVATIAAAMGRGAASKKWLKPLEESAKKTPEEASRSQLLETMRTAMQEGRPQVASAALTHWASKKSNEDKKNSLDYNFVKDILSIALLLPSADPISNPSTNSYSPDIIVYLLEHRLVCSSMVPLPGGLLGALRARNDWKSIDMAFTAVPDLSESEIVETLRSVVAWHRRKQEQGDDAMQVDEPPENTVIPLPAYLTLMLDYTITQDLVLLAFRRYIQDAEDLMPILKILHGWLNKMTPGEVQLLPKPKDMRKNEQGIWVLDQRKLEKRQNKWGSLPSLEKIVIMLQTILDSSFVSLLQHKPALPLLQKINERLVPEIDFLRLGEKMRGSVEPFAIAHEQMLKESLITPQERERELQKVDWRKRNIPVEVKNASLGLYTLEKLVL